MESEETRPDASQGREDRATERHAGTHPDEKRERALVLARGFVLELYPPADHSQHPRTVTELREMLSQMLAIAEFLSGQPTGEEATTLSQILATVKSIDSHMP